MSRLFTDEQSQRIAEALQVAKLGKHKPVPADVPIAGFIGEQFEALWPAAEVDERIEEKRAEGWEVEWQGPSTNYPGRVWVTMRRVER